MASGSLTRTRKLVQKQCHELEFASSLGRQVAANSAGVLSPSELCGRSVLYSLLQSSKFDFASSSLSNQCVFKHSSRSLPLNDSTKALSVGLPGREKHNFTPRR